jgi:hypothetical protein
MSTEWYFAEGRIMDMSKAPLAFPDAHPDSGDYILFMNPNKEWAEIEMTFYFEDTPPVKDHTRLAAESVAQHPLHVKSKGILPWNSYYGCRVRSNVFLICQRTRGEFIPNDPITDAMGSTIMHPGPLGEKEKCWAYADGIICKREDHPLEESEWVGILNPGHEEARLTITTYHSGDRQPTHWTETVSPQRIKIIKLDEQKWVIPYELYGLLIQSNVPVIVEEIRRAYERGKYQCARSMFDVIAYPFIKMK